MAFKYQVYKTQRICPIRFRRAFYGEPMSGIPDLDNRGSFRKYKDGSFDRGPVISVMQDDEIFVEIQRERIGKNAPLFATSSDKATMTISSEEQFPPDDLMLLGITGIQGGSGIYPKKANLQIHCGSPNGVVIAELGVRVFSKMNVNLTPYNVAIGDGTAGSEIPSAVDITAVIEMAKVIWQPFGVTFTVAPVQNITQTFAVAGELAAWGEFRTLLRKHWARETVNAYFVNRINFDPQMRGVLGVGLSRKFVKDNSELRISKPGIFLGDENLNRFNRVNDIHWLANDLAHEIGHFFDLQHIDNRSSTAADANNFRDDTWARRCLMHNNNQLNFTQAPPTGSPPDVGYGTDSNGDGYRGALITLKNLTDSNNKRINHITDPEYETARKTIKRSKRLY